MRPEKGRRLQYSNRDQREDMTPPPQRPCYRAGLRITFPTSSSRSPKRKKRLPGRTAVMYVHHLQNEQNACVRGIYVDNVLLAHTSMPVSHNASHYCRSVAARFLACFGCRGRRHRLLRGGVHGGTARLTQRPSLGPRPRPRSRPPCGNDGLVYSVNRKGR